MVRIAGVVLAAGDIRAYFFSAAVAAFDSIPHSGVCRGRNSAPAEGDYLTSGSAAGTAQDA